MSSYVKYYNNNQIYYKGFAERWAKWSKSASLSSDELEGISKFFKAVAKRFGLITEFRELGII